MAEDRTEQQRIWRAVIQRARDDRNVRELSERFLGRAGGVEALGEAFRIGKLRKLRRHLADLHLLERLEAE